jgi:ribonuclease R
VKKVKNKSSGIASSRSKIGRKERNNYIDRLLKEINSAGVKTDALKIKYTNDNAPKYRTYSHKREQKLTRGSFSLAKGGFGFVSVEDGYENDIFIPRESTLGAITGDIVEVSYHVYFDRDETEHTEGRVLKIIEYGVKTVVGTVAFRRDTLYKKRGMSAYLIPDDNKLNIEPKISELMGALEGEKVQLLLTRSPNSHSVLGKVIARYGDTYSKEANYEAILAECEIPVEFSKAELLEAEFFKSTPISKEGRVDRTKDKIFTIDAESAKDLDDAISVKLLSNGDYQLGVHIADVSSYVKERTHLDRAVMSRGTSVYFTDKVVPMLPAVLSNGVCSLNEGEERYALSAVIRLDKQGNIVSTKLEKSVIKSCIKGIYSEINSVFDGSANREIQKKYSTVRKNLDKMRNLYEILEKKSMLRGMMELESTECSIMLDENGDVLDIVKRQRGISERMIEQFMLCANEAVARLLSEKEIPCVYRVHENPNPEKLKELTSYLKNLGFDVSEIASGNASASEFSKILKKAAQLGLSRPVSYTMLRSMSKAKYSEIRSYHFGLALDYYCHFTSPIRRLSDLATHRIIHKVLFEDKRAELYASYAKRASRAATDTEIRAVNAERRIENLYKTLYMSKNVGKEYDAIISSVTSFGFFVELDNTVEGLVPLSELSGVYIFDEKTLTLRSSLYRFKLGDAVRVRLEEVDVIRGKLRFSYISHL